MNKLAKQLFLKTLEETKPSSLVRDVITKNKDSISVEETTFEYKNRPVYGIAVGKASRPMIAALKEKLNIPPSNLLCITPEQDNLEGYCISSSHPLPDANSRKAADALIQFVENLPPEAVVFFLLSGGASSLLCKPAEGLRLQDLKSTNALLLRSGASIHEINSVRKHLSAIKGGQLLSHFPPDCTLIDLVISDVPSDNLENIGSGPTVPDSSTFRDACDTMQQLDLWDQMSKSVKRHLKKGLSDKISETPKPGHDPLSEHHSYIIGSAEIFAHTLAKIARQEGRTTRVANEPFNEDVSQVAEKITDKINQNVNPDTNCALIFYGESTVKVSGDGKGGRNQELALRGALEIEGMDNVTWLSAGTDGIDGPTDAAGAIVDDSTITNAKEKGLNVQKYLSENDSYHFHEQLGTLLKTGPTGNNVMDSVLILIGEEL
jgi:glycerate-2-kinase